MGEAKISTEQMTNIVSNDLWKVAYPWIMPSVGVLFGTYVLAFLFKRFFKKDLPREVKTAIPMVIGALLNFFTHSHSTFQVSLELLGIGLLHGAIVAAFYDIAFRRIKKKLHGEQ